VSRLNNIVQVTELSEAAACWLQHIQTGETLGQASQATLALHADFDLQTALLTLHNQAALSGFHLESSSSSDASRRFCMTRANRFSIKRQYRSPS